MEQTAAWIELANDLNAHTYDDETGRTVFDIDHCPRCELLDRRLSERWHRSEGH